MRLFKKFISYYKPHIKLFVTDMTASLCVAFISVLYPVITRNMLGVYIPQKDISSIIFFGMMLFALYFVRMLLNYFVQYYGHMMGVKMQAQMRSDMFIHLQKLPFAFFDTHETGKIMSRMTNDLFDVTELAHHGPENLIITLITVIISFVYLSSINVYLSVIIFACVPLLIVISLILRKKMRLAFSKSKQSVAEINASLESSISGIRITKAFTNDKVEQEKFEVGNRAFRNASKDAYKAMGQFHSSTTFITDVFNVAVLIAGGLFLYKGYIDFADYSAFVVSINLFIGPLNTLIRFVEQFQNGVAGFERFAAILDEKPEMDLPESVDIKRLIGDISFKNVSYGYGDEPNVLRDVSFDVKHGETFALVGPSGGGKTTICNLIPRFYEVQKGGIFIDGKDIIEITAESLRRNIGIVQQDIYLFNASFKDNILYGRPDATNDEVIEAAKRADIHDYIIGTENGYDTVIGERGVRLSGGQKQRLCIARVFLKNPPILILDEATSALDNATEIMIKGSLDELSEGRTTIVVAHRLSTIKNADKIAVISDGKLKEIGTHEELLDKNGLYSELYSLQFRD